MSRAEKLNNSCFNYVQSCGVCKNTLEVPGRNPFKLQKKFNYDIMPNKCPKLCKKKFRIRKRYKW
jgi:hypothetical protein